MSNLEKMIYFLENIPDGALPGRKELIDKITALRNTQNQPK